MLQTPAPGGGEVRVWDPVVRITHWCVAALVLWDLWEDSGGPLHRNLGYAAAGLVLLRLVWAAVGPGEARFEAWWPTLGRMRRYLSANLRRPPHRHLGHNPLGALMMLALWSLILLLALTGWMSRLDRFWGEDWVTDLHGRLADGLMILVPLHVAGALLMSWVHRENLVGAMLHGRKRE